MTTNSRSWFRANDPNSRFCLLLLVLSNAVAMWSTGQRHSGARAARMGLPMPAPAAVFVKLFIQQNRELDTDAFNRETSSLPN